MHPTADPYDVVIENGTIVDGSGGNAFAAAVGVRDGRLTIIYGETEDAVQAERRIDATWLGDDERRALRSSFERDIAAIPSDG